MTPDEFQRNVDDIIRAAERERWAKLAEAEAERYIAKAMAARADGDTDRELYFTNRADTLIAFAVTIRAAQ